MADGDVVSKETDKTLADDLLNNKKLEEGGQFELNHCIVEAKNATIDFTNNIVSIYVWEHIFRVFMTAEVTILDTQNLLSGIEITGTEPVALEFRTLGSKFPVSINMIVSHVKKKEKVREVTNRYTLALVSPEFLNNQRVKISTCYSDGPKPAIKDIFFNRLKSKQKLWIEDNNNKNSVIIPNKSPVGAIELLSQFAKSNEGNVSFLFFQTTKSFHYRSYADMINAKRVGLSFIKGKEDPSPFKTPLAKCSRLIEFNIESDVDILKQTRLGTYASKLIEHDIWGKSIITTVLDYHNDSFDGSLKTIGNYPVTPLGPVNEEDKNLSSFSNSKVELISASRENNYTVDPLKYPGFNRLEHDSKKNRLAEINSMLIQRAKIKVAGISGIQAGDIIDIQIFIPSGAEASKLAGRSSDERLSGNWLVESVAHNIIVEDKYYCIMYIIRDSLDTEQTEYNLLNYESGETDYFIGDDNRIPD